MQEKLSPIQTELLSRADSIFASISAAVGKATDFAAVQIPEIAIQYVAYGRAYKTTLVLVFLAIFFIGLFLVVKVGIQNYYKASDDYNGDWGGSRYTASLIGLLFVLFGSVVF